MKRKVAIVLLFFLAIAILHLCKASKVRLVGGSNNNEGRVEVFYNSQWGTVCDDNWDLMDANVVCRSLGLPRAALALHNAFFGRGSGPIWMDDLRCSGNELSLLQCQHSGWGQHNCGHSEDASVVCVPMTVQWNVTNLTGVITSPGFPRYLRRAHYQWTFRPPIANAFTVLHFEDINLYNTHMARIISLTVEDANQNKLLYLKNERQEMIVVLIETGTGKLNYLSSFSSSGSPGKGFRMRYYMFNMPENDRLCQNWTAFFTQEDPGRINITLSHVPQEFDHPGPTYTNLLSYKLAHSLNQNFTIVSSRTARIEFLHPNRTYSIRLVILNTLNNKVLLGCPHQVKTIDVKLRLMGGNASNEGRVEVFYHGVWGTICTNWWDRNDANVVCRLLGLPSATYVLRYGRFGSGSSGRAWMTDLKCAGNENSLALCPHRGWTYVPNHCSNPYYTASVVCGHPIVHYFNITDLYAEITSPGYPRYTTQAHYKWRFTPAMQMTNIAIYFEEVDLRRNGEGHNVITFQDSLDYQLFSIRDLKMKPIGFVIRNKTGSLEYRSDFTSFQGKGFRMRYLVFDARSFEQALSHIFNLVVTTKVHSISVAWSSFPTDGFKVHGYLITCNSTDDWHRTVSYAIVDNVTNNGSCHRLVGLTNYEVQVLAVLTNVTDGSMVIYKSTTVKIRTVEGVPSRSPWIMSLSSSWSSIHVRWHPIPREHAHGVLTEYKVYYHDYKTKTQLRKTITTMVNNTHVILKDLLPGMKYFIAVYGLTSKGEGPRSYSTKITKCGGSVENQVYGTIENPNYRERVGSWGLSCMWDLKALSKTGLMVIILEAVDLPLSSFCRISYVALFNGQGQEAYRFCGVQKSITLTSIGSAKIVTYIRWYTRHQFLMTAKYFIFDEGFDKVPVELTWSISAKSDKSSTINVQWSEYPLSSKFNLGASKEIISYLAVCIAVHNQSNISVSSSNGQERSVNVTHLGKHTEYYVQVFAIFGNSSNSTVATANETVFRRSKNITVRTMEEVPSQAPVLISAEVITSNNILVKWKTIASEYTHGVLVGYHVYYQPTSSSNSSEEKMVFVHRNTTLVKLKNLVFLTEYWIRVAGVTKAGEGPRSRAVYVRTGLNCDKSLSGRYGEFSSPNFPRNYPSKADCAWRLGTGMNLDRIIIMFDSFELEEGTSGICSNDYVKVMDMNGNEVDRYCGSKSPFATTVSLRSAQVILHSDNAFEKKGFNATFYVIDKYSKDIDLKARYSTTTEATLYVGDDGVDNIELVVLHKEEEGPQPWKVIKLTSRNITIKGLLPAKKYSVQAVGYLNGKVYKSQLVTVATHQLPITPPTEETLPPTLEPLKQMFDYGPSEGDSIIPNTWEDLQKCFGFDLNDDGIPIFFERYYKLYICHNGVIRFGAHYIPRWPKPFSKDRCTVGQAILAPYWATTDPYSFYQPRISAVYYQMYTASQNTAKSIKVLNRATLEVNRLKGDSLSSQFKPSLVLVITWYKLRHFNQNPETRYLYNTFQAVIITDRIYTFAMYNYPSDGIQWSAPTIRDKWNLYTKGNSGDDPLPVVGWNAGCKRHGYHFNVERSGEVNIGSISTNDGKTVYKERGVGGSFEQKSHGVKGKWLFRLEISSGESAEGKCKRWFKSEPDPRPYLEYLEPCPCTLFQARWDERFMVEENGWANSKVCAVSTYLSVDNWRQKCCYSNDWWSNGALIVGHPGGGTALRYEFNGLINSVDPKGYDSCCVQSPMCHLYYQKRPSADCKRYAPPEWSWMWGDPHFVTLDGKNYTFNGLGEYVMLDVKDGFFQVQARTRLAKGDGTATVFCAVVAKERNTSKVQLDLGDEGNMTLFVDGVSFDYYSLTNASTRLNRTVVISRPKDNAFRATFPSGISVTVAEPVKGALSILLAIPKIFRNETKGLLGTWNGNATDDLTSPSGNVLPVNASSKDIHFKFGQKWQVDEITSLFTYQLGKNVSTFSNTSFLPMFIEDLKFYNESLKQKAIAACNGDINCLFDSASTKDVSVGLSTKIVGSQMVNDSNILKNSPPVFDYNTSSVVYLTVNISNSLTFNAKDPDGDSMKFNITGLPDDATVWTNESSIALQWKVTTKKLKLEIIATDRNGVTSVLRPVLHVCACHNGVCSTSLISDENQNDDRFGIMSCQCASGYTGRFCESDIDACEVNMNPCYPGVQCKDVPAPANDSGYECGSCPPGFTGEGDSCSDIDECGGSIHSGCSQICVNIPGSFMCGCNHGYLLNNDGRTCDDVNECDPASDCMQGCVNTQGSYNCTCDKYFTVDPDNPKRCLPESPCKVGNHQCRHICYVSNGVDRCTCRTGYELRHDNKSCSDIDECTTGKDRCNQKCRNTIGWYDCGCNPGYRLDIDNVTCIDIDECLEWTFNCSANLRCRNSIGSYKCLCSKGLVWNGNECQEAVIPLTTPSPSTPRTPSAEDVKDSVNVTIKGLEITEWNQETDRKFKKAVAHEVSEFCVNAQSCFESRGRLRWSKSPNVTFTAQQVHLLPGYPKQLFYSPIPDDMVAAVAFYVTFPPGVSTDVTGTVDKTILVDIVNGSLSRIGRAINKTMLSVAVFMVEKPSGQPRTKPNAPTSINPSDRPALPEYILHGIIGGSVAGLVLIIIIIALIIRTSRARKDKYLISAVKQQVEIEMKVTDYGDYNLGMDHLETDKPGQN